MLSVIVVLLAGCEEKLTDNSLATSDACTPPCWHDIVPGESSKQDALAILRTLPFVDTHSIEVVGPASWGEDMETIIWDYAGTGIYRKRGGELRLRDNHVVGIRVFLLEPLKLGNVLRIQGKPELFMVARNPDLSHHFSLAYPQNGLIVWAVDLPPRPRQYVEVITLKPEIEVVDASYFVPMGLKEYFLSIPGNTEESATIMRSYYRPWPGLGVEVAIPDY